MCRRNTPRRRVLIPLTEGSYNRWLSVAEANALSPIHSPMTAQPILNLLCEGRPQPKVTAQRRVTPLGDPPTV